MRPKQERVAGSLRAPKETIRTILGKEQMKRLELTILWEVLS